MNWADQVTEESGTLRAQNLGAAVCAGRCLRAGIVWRGLRRSMRKSSGAKRAMLRGKRKRLAMLAKKYA